MKCIKCNREYPDDRPVCPYCQTQNENIVYNNVQNNNMSPQIGQIINNDIYVNEFIGPNVDSYKSGGISFAYLFFGEYYLLYRKMYVLFFIKLLLTTLILWGLISFRIDSNYQGMIICLISYALIQLGPIFFIKSYYLSYVSSSVKNIIEQNMGNSENEILQICKRQGGTNIVLPIIVLIVVSFIFTVRNNNKMITTTNDIKIRDLAIKTTPYLNLDKDYYENISILKNTDCYLRVITSLNKNGLDSFINSNIDLNLSMSIKKINNHSWKYCYYKEKNYYFTNYNDYNYMVITQFLNNNKKCMESIDTFIDSMSFE